VMAQVRRPHLPDWKDPPPAAHRPRAGGFCALDTAPRTGRTPRPTAAPHSRSPQREPSPRSAALTEDRGRRTGGSPPWNRVPPCKSAA